MTATPRIFLSAGEPSGDLHGSNLIHALRRLRPDVVCEGFGGERMEAAGCQLHYPLSSTAIVGLWPALASVPKFVGIINRATEHLRQHRPAALVLIDYPGFNWWMARRARALGIPVVYFVPPQLWAWAPWRVRKMRRLVDRVLACLPFERTWYAERGIDAPYIGHPYFDALQQQQLDSAFLLRQRGRPNPIIGVLPGSRRHEINRNFASQMRAAQMILRRRRDCRFLVACFRNEHAQWAARVLREHFPARDRRDEGNLQDGYRGAWSLPVELCVGRTPEIIELSHSCLAVSGSVSLELLHAAKPATIVYRGPATGVLAYRLLCRVKHISLVNLLAERVLYPEHVTAGCPARKMAEEVLHWLNDDGAHRSLRHELKRLRERVARPGACDRAAEMLCELMPARQREVQPA